MCTGLEIAALIGAAASTAGTAYQLSQGKPKMPAPPQAAQAPVADAFKKQNAAAFAPGVALGAGGGSLLGAGAGPSQNVGTSTLLGQ